MTNSADADEAVYEFVSLHHLLGPNVVQALEQLDVNCRGSISSSCKQESLSWQPYRRLLPPFITILRLHIAATKKLDRSISHNCYSSEEPGPSASHVQDQAPDKSVDGLGVIGSRKRLIRNRFAEEIAHRFPPVTQLHD